MEQVLLAYCSGLLSIPVWPQLYALECGPCSSLNCQTGVYPKLPETGGQASINGCLEQTPTTIAEDRNWTIYL